MHKPVCPYCDRKAELVNGAKVYPRRPDLVHLKFWRCAPCNAYVGCHQKGKPDGTGGISDGTAPMGRLANFELRRARMQAHAAFDPLWKTGEMSRRQAYEWLAKELRVTIANCHIGLFDELKCEEVIAAVYRREWGSASHA